MDIKGGGGEEEEEEDSAIAPFIVAMFGMEISGQWTICSSIRI